MIQVVFTGPIVDDETTILSKEQLQAQLLEPLSLSLVFLMIGIFILTLPHTAIVLFHEKRANYFSDNINFIMFQVSILITGGFITSCTKLFSNSEGWFFWTSVGLFAICFLVFPVVSMCKNIYVKNMATFVSINSASTYLVSLTDNLHWYFHLHS